MSEYDKKDNRRQVPGSGRGDDKKEPPRWRSGSRSLLFWLALFLLMVVIYQFFSGFDPETAEITYTEFLKEIDGGNVSELRSRNARLTAN